MHETGWGVVFSKSKLAHDGQFSGSVYKCRDHCYLSFLTGVLIERCRETGRR